MGKRSRDEDEVPITSSLSICQSAASPAKIVELDESDDDHHSSDSRMQCLLPPHQPLSFANTEQFETHYAKEHTNRCTSCGKNFPSAHYLALHIDENHTPFRELLVAEGEKCSTPQKRRLHLIDKHMFPKVYNFRIIDRGIDKADSMLQTGQRRRLSTNTPGGHPRRVSVLGQNTAVTNGYTQGKKDDLTYANTNGQEIDSMKMEDSKSELEDLTKSMDALRFVPSSVRVKQRPRKTGS